MKTILTAVLVITYYPAFSRSADTLFILFGKEQSKLSVNQKANIKQFVRGKWNYLLIRGFADNTGSRLHNLKLSKERALSVYDYLTDAGYDNATISLSYFGKEEPKSLLKNEAYQAQNRRAEVVRLVGFPKGKVKSNPAKTSVEDSVFGLTLKDVEANALFFLLDLLFTLLLIPVVLEFRNRKKTRHLTEQSLNAINVLLDVGGGIMAKFNDTAINLYKNYSVLKNMPLAERQSFDLTDDKIAFMKNENNIWFQKITENFETYINSYRATTELFSPHLKDDSLLILISKMSSHVRAALGTMKAITFALRLDGDLPERAFVQINLVYKLMYDLVIEAKKHKEFSALEQPKTLEEQYSLLKNGNTEQ